MARYKMNWDNVEGEMLTVYSLFLSPGKYRVKIMKGKENNSPVDKAWKTGVVTNCNSHLEAFEAAKRHFIAAQQPAKIR